MTRFRTSAAVAVISLVFSPAAHAALIYTTSALALPTGTATFNEFTTQLTDRRTGVNVSAGNGESVYLDGTANGPEGVATYGNGYGLGDNGLWRGPKQYVLIQPQNGKLSTMRLTFLAGAVRSVSAFINYVPTGGATPAAGDAVITAFNASGVSLGSFDLPTRAAISTANDSINDGAYRGLTSDSNDIASVVISGRGVVMDDFSFARDASSAPEPGCLAGLAAAGVLLSRRRRPR